ncbi:MAG: hypothetical protein LBD30_07345 [Verrucomicrobiales bacterium]|nr:hypothetical protein [Verrucomicrobiales bacterium]
MITDGGEVEIAPSIKVESLPRGVVPRYGITQLMRETDGRYLPVLCLLEGNIRLTVDIGKRLGVDISYQTIHRLILGGFVEGRYLAPNTCLLNLGSFWRHYQATLDPEFWTPANLARYREGCRAYAARSRLGLQKGGKNDAD